MRDFSDGSDRRLGFLDPDQLQATSWQDIVPGYAWSGDGSYELLVRVELPVGACQLGVSAVIEETNGRKSYWALAHPPGKADFHHDDGFVLQLPAVA